MGIGMWFLAGAIATIVSRMIRPGRLPWWIEALTAMLFAIAAGLAATALDFGGWREPDWRAGAFALLSAFAAIGIARVIRLAWR